MKKTRMIALLLAALLFLLPFAGCAKAPEPVEPVEGPKLADLAETDTLVLYISQNNQRLMLPLIAQYETLYGVEVEKVVVPGTLEEYSERVVNDFMGGSGPDVLFLNQLVSLDITKTALNHNFLDLTDVLASDPDFSREDYIDGVFEAACIGGRQYTVPRSYRMSVALSSGEKLDELGFDWDAVRKMSGFLEEIARLTPYAEQNTSFMQMLYSKSSFNHLITDSGVSLIDYETGKVLPDEKNLRNFLEAYQAYFPYDYDAAGGWIISSSGDRTLIPGTSAFWVAPDIKGIATTIEIMERKSCDYVVHPIPGETGEIIGDIHDGLMAISANSKNSRNAYNFIKFMLSEDVQMDGYKLNGCFPILKEVLRKTYMSRPQWSLVKMLQRGIMKNPRFQMKRPKGF